MHSARWTPIKTASTPQTIRDLTGLRRGSLTCLGFYMFHIRPNGDKVQKWVVQCDCGAYDIRGSKPLKRHNMDDVCGVCNQEKIEFRKKFHAANGRYPDYFEYPA